MAKPLSDYELSELQRDLALMGKDADKSSRRNSWSSGPGRMRQTLRTMDQLLAPRVTSIADQASFVLERLVMGDDASVSSCEDDSQGDQADDSMELRLDLETPFDSLLSSKQALPVPIQPRPALLDAQTSCSSILSQSSRTLLDSLEKAAALDHPTLNAQTSCGDLLSHNEAIGATHHNVPRAQTQSTRDEPSALINFSSPDSPITPGDIDLVPARRPARRYSADISEADRNLIMQGAVTIAERRAWGEALSSAAAAAEKDKELIAFYANETKTLRERAHALSAQVLTLQQEKDHLTHERDELKAQVEFAQLQTRRRGSCGDIRTHNAALTSTQEDSVAVARLGDELRAAKETARAERKMLEDALSAANHRVKGLEQRCKDLDKQVTQRPPSANDNMEGLLLNLRQELRGMVSEAISESVAHEQQAMSRSSATPPDSPKSPRARNFSLSRMSEQARLRMSLSRWRNTVPSSSPPPSPLQ